MCTASLALAYGSRPTDWCWHPRHVADAVSSLRLPGAWESRAVAEAARLLAAPTWVRTGDSPGVRTFSKQWGASRHYGLEDHFKQARSCEADQVLGRGNSIVTEVSSLVADSIPTKPHTLHCMK
uniref:Uncharacterized protein n=1 Tax=Coccolithus braarudii TaxID=221442 RepID=A0A7S0LLN3_9EUKA|mmetsp:Transcript_45167/g.96033  ORF Transcript_45167/g.96033 Transcript_45167/m.96033 type:complete len:124 (+) Transcript_45167:69-440(+)